jgi:hypothetical protein
VSQGTGRDFPNGDGARGLAQLTGADQKAVNTTAFDLHLDPPSPGPRFHRLERPCDPNFWSVRVSDDNSPA